MVANEAPRLREQHRRARRDRQRRDRGRPDQPLLRRRGDRRGGHRLPGRPSSSRPAATPARWSTSPAAAILASSEKQAEAQSSSRTCSAAPAQELLRRRREGVPARRRRARPTRRSSRSSHIEQPDIDLSDLDDLQGSRRADPGRGGAVAARAGLPLAPRPRPLARRPARDGAGRRSRCSCSARRWRPSRCCRVVYLASSSPARPTTRARRSGRPTPRAARPLDRPGGGGDRDGDRHRASRSRG